MAFHKGGLVKRLAQVPRQRAAFDERIALVGRQQSGRTIALRTVDLERVGIGIALADGVFFQIIGAGKILAHANRPVDRRRVQRQFLLDFIKDFKRITRLAVHLVDEGDNRDIAHAADFEELQRARLDAFSAVDDHDGRIHRGERAVGIVGKILVAGRIEKVEDRVLIFERHHRGDHRNPAFTLNRHPVGTGVDPVLLGFDFAGKLDRAAKQQQLFRQCRLARIRMGDDGKGAAAGDF